MIDKEGGGDYWKGSSIFEELNLECCASRFHEYEDIGFIWSLLMGLEFDFRACSRSKYRY